MAFKVRSWRTALLASCAGMALGTALPAAAAAEGPAREYAIGSQDLGAALRAFAMASGHDVVFDPALVRGRTTPGVRGAVSDEAALRALLEGTELAFEQTASGGFVVRAPRFRPADAEAGGGGSEVEALIVTAQKREEDIQDVPIAMSAFSQEALERSQIAGGPDLMTQIPNMTFTKTNFASYSIQIRGIGTQAISATTDAAVAVAFNNSSIIRNRLFEQEFYDLERVEVLRGPQGTLYGRNATAGVVNIISAKPKFDFEAKASADVANYGSTRLEGMVNIPLAEDTVALRLAGAWTKRDGFVTNEITGNPIDGRDLWSTRLSLRFAPTDAIDVNLIWEHFEEDDDRLRSGKQLCKTDDRTVINGASRDLDILLSYSQPFSQGCLAESLYAPESFQVPDGKSLPYYLPLRALRFPAFRGRDPYLNTTQSRDLRVIESTVDPQYRAKSDLGEIQISIDLAENLTLVSETVYGADELFSSQDYNRFNTAPGAFDQAYYNTSGGTPGALINGIFCDPQIGCADRLVAMDLSTAESRQFSQEIRLSSDYEGPFNFSFGGNFLRYDTEDKYYVFINTLSLYSAQTYGIYSGGGPPTYEPGVTDNLGCQPDRKRAPDPAGFESLQGCIYMDPNPITNLNDDGHNYFLSRNPYKLISYAAFGEAYYNITPDLKLTGGLRMTVDKKAAPRIPSWLLAARTIGLTVAETIEQEWREPTGRLALDWKPALSFTDETLLYASYARGYKAGGANPPAAGVVSWLDDDIVQSLSESSATQPKTFEPEFVNAFEVGSKNTLLDGSLTLNFGAFYYDYTGYQISYIVNRSAVNLNFDAEIWGLELEADWRPLENLRLGFKGGYENTRVADGSKAVDVMDRTAGNPDWIVVRPFPSFPSNCILPMSTVTDNTGARLRHHPGMFTGGDAGPCEYAYSRGVDPLTKLPYVPNPTMWVFTSADNPDPIEAPWIGYEGWDPTLDYGNNHGEGFYKDLSGKELPNAPHFTGTLTADYTVPLRGEWMVNLHADLYYQSEAWTRIFNTEGYDKLKAYTNVNLAAIFTNEDAGWKVMAYVKNVMDRDSITGAFLNSDDSGLTTNVFLTEPRLYGLRVTKEWTGGGFWGLGDGSRRTPGTPYPFQVEIGAGVSRFDGSVETYAPDWFSPALAPALSPQEDDLDWGDIRDVRLTYAPAGGWRVSAAYLYGKTNGSHLGVVHEDVPGAINAFTHYYIQRDNEARVTVDDAEEYTVADFMVGKEIGLGAWGESSKSTVSAGLRYASFKSTSSVYTDGHSEGYVAPVLDKYTGQITDRANTTSLDSVREFEGTGPALSWESALRLFGDDEHGHVDLNWSVAGGVLFGKQTAVSIEDRWAEYRSANPNITTTLYDEVVPRSRTEDVTVPNLSLTLGLSYAIDRVKVSTGYSYDRFFDAVDGGIEEAKQFDRTIHGPYLKFSLGFGG